MQVNISMEQAELLLEILQEKERRLQLEIAHTSRREFRHSLQHQQFVLEGMLEIVNLAKANILQECP